MLALPKKGTPPNKFDSVFLQHRGNACAAFILSALGKAKPLPACLLGRQAGNGFVLKITGMGHSLYQQSRGLSPAGSEPPANRGSSMSRSAEPS